MNVAMTTTKINTAAILSRRKLRSITVTMDQLALIDRYTPLKPALENPVDFVIGSRLKATDGKAPMYWRLQMSAIFEGPTSTISDWRIWSLASLRSDVRSGDE